MSQTSFIGRQWFSMAVIGLVLLVHSDIGAAQTPGARGPATSPAEADRTLLKFLDDGASAGELTVPVLVTRRTPVDPRLWRPWVARGVSYAVNVTRDTWILSVATSREAGANARMVTYLKTTVGATKALPYLSPYKARADLMAGKFRFAAMRRAGEPNVNVAFFADTPPIVIRRTIAAFNLGPAPAEQVGGPIWALHIDPRRIAALAALNQVYVVDESIPRLPLMNEMRAQTGVDPVQAMTWPGAGFAPIYNLSGLGVRLSNKEGLATAHPDFKLDPGDTVARWAGCGSDNGHGAMTAGLMLGDGSGSVGGGAASPYRWRGVAPNATFVCWSDTAGSGRPDVANFSFVESFGDYTTASSANDARMRGAYGPTLRVLQVRAAGNNGNNPPQYDTEMGYYSMLGTSKNSLVVANVDAIDLRWQGTGSSLGLTFDQRIKPDVAAPGTIVVYTGPLGGVDMDIEYVRVMNQATPVVDWSFSPGGGYYGWGQNLNNDQWWTLAETSLSLQTTACGPGSASCLRLHMNGAPWHQGFRGRPYVGTFARPMPQQPEDLNIIPSSQNTVKIKYRISPLHERDLALRLFFGNQDIADPSSSNNYTTMSNHEFPVIADGAWHVATVPVGSDPNWTGKPLINHLGLVYAGSQSILHVPALGGTVYGGAGGTSAAAPVVAGVLALMLEQMTRSPLNVVLADHVSWSPYFRAQPGTGAPLPSTLKALAIHTATDLAYAPHVSDAPNADTGALPSYGRGPDPYTGYGLINAKAAIDLINRDAGAAPSQKKIFEDQFTLADVLPANATPPCSNGCPWGYRQYTITIPAGRLAPLKVTLAYSDIEGAALPDTATQSSPRLVNNLELELISPSGQIHRPWTIDPLYLPPSLPVGYVGNIEPEPIPPSAVHPARRDLINERDNVKQVLVDFPQAGQWKVVVAAKTYGAPPPQSFSLVIDGAQEPPAANLSGGKIVYSSPVSGGFGSKLQLFVKAVGSSTETQITNGPASARDPSWSYDGNYIVHITEAGWKVTWVHVIWNIWIPWFTWQPESVDIRSPSGALLASYPTAALTGRQHARYPDWAPDGKSVVVTTFNGWGELELRLIKFSAVGNFASPTTSILVPTNFGGNSEDPGDGDFSQDGKYVYFNASSNADASRLYRVTVVGGLVEPVLGDGLPVRRGFAASVSPDGQELIYNSELYKDAVADQINEEMMSVGVLTGAITQRTHKPGNEYGRFAKNGVGRELLFQSNTSPGAPYDLYLMEYGTISAPITATHKVEGGADWVK